MADTNQTCTFELNTSKVKDGKTVLNYDIPTCHVTILSPSFGSPGVFEPGKPITLYVLTDKDFLDQYNKDPKYLAEKIINFHLKITPWKPCKGLEDKLLYAKDTASSHITCTFLGDLRGKTVHTPGPGGGTRTYIPPETRIKHNKEKLVACIRESTRD